MSCENITQRLNDYCDGDLVGSDRVEIERHLESCAECRAELAALRSLVGEAASLRQGLEPERDLWPAIENRLRPRSGTVLRGRWHAMSRVGLAAAAALFAVGADLIGFPALLRLVARRPGLRSLLQEKTP